MRSTSILAIVGVLCASSAGAGIPQELADAARKGGISEEDLQRAETQPMAWIYEKESRDRQVTVLGLAKIAAPPQTITNDLVKKNGLLKSESLRQTGVFSDPAVPADVAEYQIPESDLEALTDCEVENCKFKLSEKGVENLEKIDWSRPEAGRQVEALMRKGMVDFVRRYEERGHEALLETVGKEEPQSFAEGAETLTDQLGLSKQLVPALRDHLLRYPKAGIEGARDRILWTVRNYGYRPITSIVHSIIYQPPGKLPVTLIALKNLYASHYFHARQKLIMLLADPEDPNVTYVGYSDRMLFDGDVGSIKRRILEAGVVKNAINRLERVSAEYE
jgi:hypothetical protein